VDAKPFSVLNIAPPKGSQDATIEVDAPPFSVLNTAPPKGSQDATIEVDGIFFSVQNNASSDTVNKKALRSQTSVSGGQNGAAPTGSTPSAKGQEQDPENHQ